MPPPAFADAERWRQLNESYQCRNGIIHAGQTASEADAEQALAVARWVIAFTRAAQAG